MKLKLDGDKAVVVDGKPVYVAEDGREVPFDYPATIAAISRLNGEAKSHRERAEAAEQRLRVFGDLDPDAARDALTKLQNITDKKLIDAGEAEQVRAAAITAVEDKYKPVAKERDALMTQLVEEKIGGAFRGSKFIAERVAIPVDFMRAAFGSAFALEDGQIVAKGRDGNRIFSSANPGAPASFEEAIEHLVATHPDRNNILRSSGAVGGGAPPAGGVGARGAGRPTITRAQFDALDPAAKMQAARGANIVD